MALSKLAWPWLVDGESVGSDVFTERPTGPSAPGELLGGTSRRGYVQRRCSWRSGGVGQQRYAGGGYGGSIERYAEHHRAVVELSSALLRPRVDGGDVATEMGLAAELRRARTRYSGLPSVTSGHKRR